MCPLQGKFQRFCFILQVLLLQKEKKTSDRHASVERSNHRAPCSVAAAYASDLKQNVAIKTCRARLPSPVQATRQLKALAACFQLSIVTRRDVARLGGMWRYRARKSVFVLACDSILGETVSRRSRRLRSAARIWNLALNANTYVWLVQTPEVRWLLSTWRARAQLTWMEPKSDATRLGQEAAWAQKGAWRRCSSCSCSFLALFLFGDVFLVAFLLFGVDDVTIAFSAASLLDRAHDPGSLLRGSFLAIVVFTVLQWRRKRSPHY